MKLPNTPGRHAGASRCGAAPPFDDDAAPIGAASISAAEPRTAPPNPSSRGRRTSTALRLPRGQLREAEELSCKSPFRPSTFGQGAGCLNQTTHLCDNKEKIKRIHGYCVIGILRNLFSLYCRRNLLLKNCNE